MAKNLRSFVFVLSVLLLSSGLAIAQDQENQFNFGYRSLTFGEDSDKARFQRYNDFRSGFTLDLFNLKKSGDKYSFELKGNNVGYRDQSFEGSIRRYGKFKLSFGYDQIPLFYSDSTRTLYSISSSGALVLDDAIQKGVEARTLTLKDAVLSALPFELRSTRNVFDVKLKYNSSPSFAYVLDYKDTHVTGSRPWGANFGFTLANQVAKPNDYRTRDVNGGIELNKRRGHFSLGFEHSTFTNNLSDLTWDNPLRFNDSTSGPAMGRQAVWPNTTSNSVHTMGSLRLPGHSQATAYLSFGQLTNDTALLPFTINSALPVIPLDRPNSDILVNVMSMNYSFTSRPASWLFMNTKYRHYVFNNLTTPFKVEQAINYDTSVTTLNVETKFPSYNNHAFSTDITVSPFSHLGFRTGFKRENNHRTHSIVEESTEDTKSLSVDLTDVSWLSLRGVAEYSSRAGSEIDTHELLAGGFQPSVRMFDISDREKDRYSVVMVLTPISWLSLNASSSIGKEEYPATDTRTVFGLRSNDNNSYTLGFDFVPIDKINFGVSYGFDRYKALQVSRTANPLPAGGSLDDPNQQFNDPRRDWSNDVNDFSTMWQGSVGFMRLIPNTDINLGYNDIYSKSVYVLSLTPNTVLPAVNPLPPVTNRLRQKTVESRYYISKHVSLGLVYRFDQYEVDDFAFNPRLSLAEPATSATQNYLMLGDFRRPYKAQLVITQFNYSW